jgi:hypothetical protein
MSIEIGIYMNWNDSRILTNSTCMGELEKTSQDKIWKPNPYILFTPSPEPFRTLTGDKAESFIKSEHELEWWVEGHFQVQCQFDFSLYPFDVQICKFKVSSKVIVTRSFLQSILNALLISVLSFLFSDTQSH